MKNKVFNWIGNKGTKVKRGTLAKILEGQRSRQLKEQPIDPIESEIRKQSIMLRRYAKRVTNSPFIRI